MLCYERLREAARDPGKAISLDPQHLGELNPTLAYLIKSVERLGQTIRLFELVDESPVRVILATTEELLQTTIDAYKIGSGLSRFEAVRQALVELVGALQSQQSGARTNGWPLLFAGFALPPDLRASVAEKGLEEETANTVEELEAFLRKRGREVLFVNTTTEDVWETETFITGRVLLTAGQL